jgi:hypothetical protein
MANERLVGFSPMDGLQMETPSAWPNESALKVSWYAIHGQPPQSRPDEMTMGGQPQVFAFCAFWVSLPEKNLLAQVARLARRVVWRRL